MKAMFFKIIAGETHEGNAVAMVGVNEKTAVRSYQSGDEWIPVPATEEELVKRASLDWVDNGKVKRSTLSPSRIAVKFGGNSKFSCIAKVHFEEGGKEKRAYVLFSKSLTETGTYYPKTFFTVEDMNAIRTSCTSPAQ
jgi:hypothetical protein